MLRRPGNLRGPIRAGIAALCVVVLFVVPAVTVAAAAPTIGGISPITGPTNGNTAMMISGTNLSTTPSNAAGVTVAFGGIGVPVFCMLTCDTQFIVFTPAHNAGSWM